MRLGLFGLVAGLSMTGGAVADSSDTKTYYVRYIINMDFLPPLIGERKCERQTPCSLVKLDHFEVVLTAPHRGTGQDTGLIEVDCSHRQCALPEGQSRYTFMKRGRFIRFAVNDHLYHDGGHAVVRYPGTEIGEILLAF